MRRDSAFLRGCTLAATILFFAPGATFAQVSASRRRITEPIDETKLTTLRGNTHPLARPEFDRGAAPLSLPMERMLLVVKRSPEQEAALDTLLEQQQDASSPDYHVWLTPEQFGQQFGPSGQDIQTVTSWLQSHGFQVARVSNGRTVIEFSGSAGQVRAAFHTEIHRYTVNGEDHWANASDPQIPSALFPVVAGIDTLHNFPRQAMHHLAGLMSRSEATGEVTSMQPLFTLGGNCGVSGVGCHAISPYDFSTIYNVLPLWTATPTPVTGTGQTIAIVSESNINIQDVRDFRNYFGLPANDPTVIVDGTDPGLNDAETEADLDVQWAGGVAPNATIELVVAQSTEASLGADIAAEYAVDNNLAPILNVSYGICEAALGTSGNQFFNQLWQQAAAQGISVTVASGDSGSAVCDRRFGNPPLPAKYGLQVSGFSSTPYNIAVGGTDFNDLTNVSIYWNSTNSTPPGNPSAPATVSAKSYIPETTWNNTCTNAVFGNLLGFSSNAETNCNNPQLVNFVVAVGGSGGKSVCTTGTGQDVTSCGGGYAKPSWQTALTPNDNKRDVPDVSLFSSVASPSGSFYVICEADLVVGYTSCNPADSNTRFIGIGGTSASAPAFAGILALVEQKTGTRQGNANYILYKLAGQSGASCNSSSVVGTSCVFYDVTNGTIAMPCSKGSPNCTVTNGADAFGVLSGYSTTAGYDLATGLGSVNAANLVNAWNTAETALTKTTTTLQLNSGTAVNITHGASVPVSISVAPQSGSGTPTGNVSLIANTAPPNAPSQVTQQGVQGFTLTSGTCSGSPCGTVAGTTNALPGGTYNVVAQYAGDGTFGLSMSSPTSVTVAPETSKTSLGIVTFDPTTGQIRSANATTFTYGSPYILRADVTNSSSSSCFNATSATFSYGCPTGTINLTDNSAPLGPGTFTLNSEGYTEYQAIQLNGGSHSLAASYAGDPSYNASSATDAVTVTPAPTTTAITSPVSSVPPQNVVIGQAFNIAVQTQAYSTGVAPTGTYAFFDGTTHLTGPVSTNGFTVPSSGQVFFGGGIQTTISAPSGSHILKAHYSGDTNYGSSDSSAVTVNALYPVTISTTYNPNNIILGDSVTLTATVSTGNPASSSALKPTGTIAFSSSAGPITGTVTTTTGQDSSGNWVLQATVTTTPQQSENMYVNYSGDTNYAPSSQTTYLFVTIPDFNVTANTSSLVITAGQTGSVTLTITPMTNYISTVNLSCYGGVLAGTQCAFSPSSVTLSNGASATATLMLAVPPPSSNLTAVAAPVRMRGAPIAPTDRGMWWALGAVTGLASLLLLAQSRRRRYLYGGLGLAVLCGMSFVAGCGGGGGGGGAVTGGGGGGPTGPVPTTTTLSTSSTKIAQDASATLTATVKSSKPVTGNVSFLDASFPGVIAPYVNLVNGTAQSQMINTGSLPAGTHVITAQYSGDANNQSSQSGGLSIVVTGTSTVLVVGQTSTDTHTFQLNVTVQ